MPLPVSGQHPTLIVRRAAFERAGLNRAAIDAQLGLTDEEFRVEGGLVVIGPILDEAGLQNFLVDLEEHGLVYYEDFFDLSGNWPDWVRLFVGQA